MGPACCWKYSRWPYLLVMSSYLDVSGISTATSFCPAVIIFWKQNVGIRCLGNVRQESKMPAFSLGMGIAPWLDIMELSKSKYCDLACSGMCKEGESC